MKPYKIPAQKYFVIEDEIKKSRFIAHGAHTKSAKEAKEFVNNIKSEHKQANHNCYCFITGIAGDTNTAGMSDDGEPQGTAGKPMLNTLIHSDIGEITIVVTRYFGGIKLGTGGLVRAYSGMVKLLLENIPTEAVIEKNCIKVTSSYSIYEKLKLEIIEAGGEILKEDFTENVDIIFECKVEDTDNIREIVTELTNGKAGFLITKK